LAVVLISPLLLALFSTNGTPLVGAWAGGEFGESVSRRDQGKEEREGEGAAGREREESGEVK
jgi:hypothetical protein